MHHRRMRGAVLVGLLAGLLTFQSTAIAADSTTATPTQRQSYNGTIGEADFRVEVPDRWNGTLVLYSHGYMPPGFPAFPGIGLTNRLPGGETETWLLEHGYALAASQFQEKGVGYQVQHGLQDQLALLDWFDANVGRPRHTVASGQSLGASIAVLLAEAHPDRFDGVATMCAADDSNGTFNAALDINFAVKTLLAPGQDIELVHATDPAASTGALVQAVQQALTTAQGRARLALGRRVEQRRGLVLRARTPTDGSDRAHPPAGDVDPERVHRQLRPERARGSGAQGRWQPVLEHRDRLPPAARPVQPGAPRQRGIPGGWAGPAT